MIYSSVHGVNKTQKAEGRDFFSIYGVPKGMQCVTDGLGTNCVTNFF